MVTEFVVGDIVKSLAGHDKNHLFIIVSIDKNQESVIIDGKLRKKDCPKRKNAKHLTKVAHDLSIIDKINSKTATDKEIYKMIKVYNTNIKE